MLKIVIGLGALLLLTACIPLQPTNLPAPQGGHYASAQQLHDWTVRGSILIRSPQESTHARFNWQQRDQNYSINFFGPLGTYHHQLIGTPKQVTLIDQQDHATTAQDPESLLRETVGWNLPIRHLEDWIRGLPKTKGNWKIQYDGYTVVQNTKLPTQIQLTYPNLLIKIKIDEWQIP